MTGSVGSLASALVQTFIPIFVAIDVLGVLPIYVGLVADKDPAQRRAIALQATVTAFVVGVVFVLVGDIIFSVMGITLLDFRIAGGILLFILATADLVGDSERRRSPAGTVGIFPIGIPLIIGPAALTTLLFQHESRGLALTLVALVANLAIVWLCLRHADILDGIMGRNGSQAFAKVASLLLASIGVMMVRRGLADLGLVRAG